MIKRRYLVFLVLALILVFVLYRKWFSFDAFLAGDWNIFFPEALRDFLLGSIWNSWHTSLGGVDVFVWQYPYCFFESVFGYFNLASNVSDKLLILLPLAFFSLLFPFLLLRKIFRSEILAFIGAMYFSYSSYILAIHTEGHQDLSMAGVWGVLSLYLLMRMREEMRGRWAVLAGMMLAVAGYYDFRFAYIFFGVGVLYFLWEWWGMVRPHPSPLPEGEGGENPLRPSDTSPSRGGGGVLFRLFGVFALVFVGLNVFWVLPFGAAGAVSENGGMGRDLFGNDYFELEDAMYLSHPFWTGYGVEWFRDHAAPWWLSALGVLAWIGFWVGRKNRTVVFFTLLSVIGILLGKQVSEPWGNLYYFLYDHIPGFNAFREASKFYVLVALGYAVGIGALVERLLPSSNSQSITNNSQQRKARKREDDPHPNPLPEGQGDKGKDKNPLLSFLGISRIRVPLERGDSPHSVSLSRRARGMIRWLRYAAVAGIAGLALWNANLLVTGRIGTMFVPREIHEDYYRYREFINGQQEYFRVLSVPVPSKWMVYTNRHPKAGLVDLMRGPWEEFSLPAMDGHPEREERKELSPLEQGFSDRLLDVSAIRYVAVPRDDPDNADDFFGAYGDRDVFLAHLDALPYLRRIDAGTGSVVVYENVDARPHLYLTGEPETIRHEVPMREVTYEAVSPSEYRVEIPAKLLANPHPNSLLEGEGVLYLNFAESYHPGWKVRIGDFSWWDALRRPGYFLPDELHIGNGAGLNTFRLDRDSLVPGGDGAVRLTVFFRPQAYLYLGLGISGAVLAACLGYLGWDLARRRRRAGKGKE